MKRKMNIFLTIGRRNLKFAYVAIKSLFIHNQSREIHLYIVSEDLEVEDLTNEMELAMEYGHQIHVLRFDEKQAQKYIHIKESDHWSVGVMSSYWLFHELLPEDVDRIMVIEADTVTVGDFSEIYDMDFNGCYVICPGPEHKPKNHRQFMERLGGDTLTFVLSMYDVKKIREDFALTDILSMDEKVKQAAGYSQMEFTFGMLFRGRIKYVPGRISCIDENERYMEELGYDYIVECERTVKIIHFSSYKDYGKPWNPVSIMPGYVFWWQYAQGSPYYKTYFSSQWEIYAKTRNETELLRRGISERNILACAMAAAEVISLGYWIRKGQFAVGLGVTGTALGVGFAAAIGIRRGLILWQEKRTLKK